MTTLITGHKGYIGSRLNKWLGAEGIDICDGHNLLTCKLPADIDIVYHLAAQSDVQASWDDPLHDLDNIRIAARLAHSYPNAKIIYANSCASIGKDSPYGFSKWAAGEYLMKFHPNVVNCVFPNIYGEGSRSVVDIFKGQSSVVVYGSGKQTRDYVHIDDIVNGLVQAAEWPAETYFMGSGVSTSVLELAKGKRTVFKEAKKEAFEVQVPNTTPNWAPTTNVMDYLC